MKLEKCNKQLETFHVYIALAKEVFVWIKLLYVKNIISFRNFMLFILRILAIFIYHRICRELLNCYWKLAKQHFVGAQCSEEFDFFCWPSPFCTILDFCWSMNLENWSKVSHIDSRWTTTETIMQCVYTILYAEKRNATLLSQWVFGMTLK